MIYKAAMLIVAVLLSACGGGGGGSAEPSSSNNTPSTSANNIFMQAYSDLPNISGYFPCSDPFIGRVLPIDMNRDGLQDLLVMSICDQWGKVVTLDGPTPNSMIALIANKDRTYRLGNAEIFGAAKSTDIGGAVRKHVIADFNDDGYLDIGFAVNREDGRPGVQPWLNWASQAAFLMSNGNGTYRVDKVGPSMYHHNITLIEYGDNKFEALFSSNPENNGGNSPSVAFKYDEKVWKEVTSYPMLQGASTTALRRAGQSPVTDGLISACSWPSLILYERAGNGQWVSSSEIRFEKDSRGKINLNGLYFDTLNFWESCPLRLNAIEGQYSAFLAAPDNAAPYQPFLFLKRLSGKLELAESVIIGEEPYNHTYYFQCEDFNGDGYDDIFMTRIKSSAFGANSTMSSIIYLNNKSGKLVARTPFPAPNKNYAPAFSYYADLNGDGVKDLIYWTSRGADGTGKLIPNPITIHYGLKNLSLSD